jgi:hypothetical protein
MTFDHLAAITGGGVGDYTTVEGEAAAGDVTHAER